MLNKRQPTFCHTNGVQSIDKLRIHPNCRLCESEILWVITSFEMEYIFRLTIEIYSEFV